MGVILSEAKNLSEEPAVASLAITVCRAQSPERFFAPFHFAQNDTRGGRLRKQVERDLR